MHLVCLPMTLHINYTSNITDVFASLVLYMYLQLRVEAPKKEVAYYTAHSVFANVKLVVCNITDDAQVFLSLYDAKEECFIRYAATVVESAWTFFWRGWGNGGRNLLIIYVPQISSFTSKFLLIIHFINEGRIQVIFCTLHSHIFALPN